MPPVADTTNAYSTVDKADAYFDERLHTETWFTAAVDDKNRSLIQATRMMDSYLEWIEEIDKTDVPEQVANACRELAIVLLSGDLQAKDDLQGIKRLKVDGVVEIERESGGKGPIIPSYITAMLKAFAYTSSGSLLIIRS